MHRDIDQSYSDLTNSSELPRSGISNLNDCISNTIVEAEENTFTDRGERYSFKDIFRPSFSKEAIKQIYYDPNVCRNVFQSI